MKLRSKIIVAGAVSMAVLGGGAAFAFFTSGGAGGGNASAAAPAPLEFSGNASAALYPGQGVPLTISVQNTNNGPIRLVTVYGTAKFNDATLDALCKVKIAPLAGDTNLPANMGAPVPVGTTTILLEESGTDQSACIGRAIAISYSTTPPSAT